MKPGKLPGSYNQQFVQQQYALDNPLKFAGYGRHCWGITASDGPGPDTIKVSGIERQFFDYLGRGVPYGPDDGGFGSIIGRNSFQRDRAAALDLLDHMIRIYKGETP